ncbi:hypothetical protein RhiirC2_773567 [Rhizophagus irregularis]|uniref:Uncharacterized protein n=1 Tax=Rhizophagus irregularis TaxID=588596 RepID=A0A2N1NNN9_9GLOM|nr:hypothetical protein RhiirC2_773567 [Rhizophagus irregularis]
MVTDFIMPVEALLPQGAIFDETPSGFDVLCTNNSTLEIVGEENSRRVYYTIEALEELLCITEGKLYKCGHWFRPESGAIRNCVAGSEDEKELHKNVKRVTEVIVVLLMDRVDVDKKPVMKKQLVQGYFEDRRNLYISMDVLYNELAFIFALLVHFPEEIFPGDMHANPSDIRF